MGENVTAIQEMVSQGSAWVNRLSLRIIGDSFEGPSLDLNLWTPSLTGSATQTATNTELTLSTGITANSTAMVQSLRRAFFVPGTFMDFRCGARVSDTGVANNVRRWGAYDANNGFFFSLNGTVLNIGTRRAAVDTLVASTSWNGVYSTNEFVLDTNYHTYAMTWFGNKVIYWIDDLVAHSITSAQPQTLVQALSLKETVENNNSGGAATNEQLFIHCITIERRGMSTSRPHASRITGAATTVLKSAPGTLKAVSFGAATAVSTVTIFDNTAGSGTVIFAYTGNSSVTPSLLPVDVDFSIGLTVVTVGAPTDITVLYE